tara:strand:- start:716 stop:1267 length:552 start_codon:yes stop_codon:yes gene_type:complete
MSNVRPVGINSTLSTSTSSVQTSAFQQQSDSVRVLAEGAGVYVNTGPNPTSTNENYYVGLQGSGTVSLGPVRSQPVVAITKGSSTILQFQEGTGSAFEVGDAVTLTVTGQPTLDFEHRLVTNVNNSSGVGGQFSCQITVDYDSSAVGAVLQSVNTAILRKSFKVSVKTETGTGTAYIQQVQRS